jgi:putative FmdB family regulatory protein
VPIYEYRCADCGQTFEALVRAGRTAHCPECGGTALDKLLTAATVLSGRTNRPTGSTCCGRSERCDAPPCSDGSPCRRDMSR